MDKVKGKSGKVWSNDLITIPQGVKFKAVEKFIASIEKANKVNRAKPHYWIMSDAAAKAVEKLAQKKKPRHKPKKRKNK